MKKICLIILLAIFVLNACATPPAVPKEGYKTFSGPKERAETYKQAYEEGWIKSGMIPKEVVALIGLPTGYTYRGIGEPGPCWIYSLSAWKDFFIGFGHQLRIYWDKDDKVIEVRKIFVM